MQQQRDRKRLGGRGLLARRQAGFTLTELLIGIAIIAMTLGFGLPSMFAWLRSSQIRNAAESIQSGLQLARAEAVRRNTSVQFALTSLAANSGADWSVSCVTPSAECPGAGMAETEIQKYSALEGAPSAQVASPQATVVFTGMGRLTPVPASTIAINVTNPNGGTCVASGGTMRCLRILVSAGGQLKMCDPALPTTNARGC